MQIKDMDEAKLVVFSSLPQNNLIKDFNESEKEFLSFSWKNSDFKLFLDNCSCKEIQTDGDVLTNEALLLSELVKKDLRKRRAI